MLTNNNLLRLSHSTNQAMAVLVAVVCALSTFASQTALVLAVLGNRIRSLAGNRMSQVRKGHVLSCLDPN